MKKPLFCLILLTAGLVLAEADDPTLQVSPSDQVRYPDASQILNKTDPTSKPAAATPAPADAQAAPTSALPSAKPLVAGVPIPVAPVKPSAPPTPPAASATAKTPTAGSWFLKWTLSTDESGALGWAQALNRGASVHKVKEDLWEVWAGPFDAGGLKDALAGQAGVATLVRK